MRFIDLMSETLHSLTSNKVRSGLTILGIVVGIASVIAMIAIGNGSQASIEDSIAAAGSNLLTVTSSSGGMGGPGPRQANSSVTTLSREDAAALAQIDLIAGVAPYSSSQAQLIATDANANSTILGVTGDYQSVKNLAVASGSFISARDDEKYAQVVVLGATLAEDLYGTDIDPVGQTIRSGNLLMTVIGVLEEKGTSGPTNVDDAALIPLTTLQRYLSGSDSISGISLTVSDESQMDAAEGFVTDTLLAEHGITDSTAADFSVTSSADMLETVSTVTGTFTTLLAAIASISLLVGGIGIMNMMLTTVTERTREIGLRKAIGADDNVISSQFLAESIVLTLLGGIIGIAAGWAIASVAANLLNTQAIVSLNSVGLAVGVCAVIGLVFGYYPARRAAAMSPIEALRYQ
jgi:putative ABC transport system permease protein